MVSRKKNFDVGRKKESKKVGGVRKEKKKKGGGGTASKEGGRTSVGMVMESSQRKSKELTRKNQETDGPAGSVAWDSRR